MTWIDFFLCTNCFFFAFFKCWCNLLCSTLSCLVYKWCYTDNRFSFLLTERQNGGSSYVCVSEWVCVNENFTSQLLHARETGDKRLSSISPRCEHSLRSITSSDNSLCNTANRAAIVLNCINSQLEGDKSSTKYYTKFFLKIIIILSYEDIVYLLKYCSYIRRNLYLK